MFLLINSVSAAPTEISFGNRLPSGRSRLVRFHWKSFVSRPLPEAVPCCVIAFFFEENWRRRRATARPDPGITICPDNFTRYVWCEIARSYPAQSHIGKPLVTLADNGPSNLSQYEPRLDPLGLFMGSNVDFVHKSVLPGYLTVPRHFPNPNRLHLK